MSANKTLDPKNTIAFQGSPGAHSDGACRNAYPYMDTMPCRYFEDVFEAVENGTASLGLIPIENSKAGRVAEIHNILPDTTLHIVGEYIHQVHHHLIGVEGASLETLKTAYSHPQALMQSRGTLRDLNINAEPHTDTAAAAEMIKEKNDPSIGALASELAAELNGLKIIKEDVQDDDNNRTLFLAFSKEPADIRPEKGIVTSLIFATRNIAAGLYKVLGGFATNHINILKLESYIKDFDSNDAQFFITFEGHPEEKHVQMAMEELGFYCNKVKVLGVYKSDPARNLGN